ncbi:MAG TPA: dephospho-CoA kinase [Hyphomicrobiaceae bacterium]|nr:dephospho-CoA kinase [Hyphomicrobiaceae bacterium]
MLLIGLTGSIGMGKSTAAGRFRHHGLLVVDADAEVHTLYEGAAVPLIEAAFPGTTGNGRVDRQRLSAKLLADSSGFKKLNAIVHPLVLEAERAQLRAAAARGDQLAVIEVPLLFETGGAERVDVTVVVSAPAEAQRARVLARPGMTPEKLDAILARQMPDAEKRRRADYVVDTGGSIPESEAAVDKIVAELRGRKGDAYERHWA